jgi:SAM-dependent methyltransferase
MITQGIKRALGYLGLEIHRIEPFSQESSARVPVAQPRPIDPVWPLPRRSGGPSEPEIREKFAKYDSWHYAYEFEGGLSFPARHNKPGALADAPERPLQRFRHFMPYLIQAENGSLQGKRILDIGCNSGFWSIQCALLGAEVVGFDARPELIEQAELVKSIVGVDNAAFRLLDFWDMSPQSLHGTFDIVLNLGMLYHLPSPLEALQLTKSMARRVIVLDTAVYPSNDSVIRLSWEEPFDIRAAVNSGIVAAPSKRAVDLMLRHVGVAGWYEIPVRTTEMPPDYLENRRASWLIEV